MGNFIISIANYLWIICVLALLVSLFTSTDKSSRTAAAVWVVIGLMMDRVSPELIAITQWHKTLGICVWYLSWAIFNTLTITLIFIIHKRNHWQVSRLSLYICLCSLVMVILQVLRLIDRMLLETNLLVTVYKFGVPAINIAVVASIVIWVVTSIKIRKGIN